MTGKPGRDIRPDVTVQRLSASAYTIPTATPESDGTLEWNATTLVIVEVAADGARGLGYSYTHASAVRLIAEMLGDVVLEGDALDVTQTWTRMRCAVRNVGQPGVAASAIAAVDNALWDLKARLFGVSIGKLLGTVRERVPAYGSGGFTSYDIPQLQSQLADWTQQGLSRVKMKVGRAADKDEVRVAAARRAIGDRAELFVDANGAYQRKTALALAQAFAGHGVTWFEEPVSSDDLEGLRLLRDRAPPGVNVAAGEYGYDSTYFRRMLEAQAVDVLQADATRCAGASGFLRAAALCEAFHVPLSAHTAPALHAPLCCAAPAACHLEWFFDHARIEGELFEGGPRLEGGDCIPDSGRPGFGIEFRAADAERYRVVGPLALEASV